jgi:hypothetical protein
MAIKKIKAKSPDPYLSKTKGDNTLARIAHVNQLVDQINSTNLVGPAGPQGVQGPTGPQGVPGPVGPAGLNWQGAWASGTSYVADDAVGYGGASYFCILATSGTTTPDLATTNWALLASQGAIGATGATGAQGPQGAQGIQGPAGGGNYKVYSGYVILSGTPTFTVLENTLGVTLTWAYVGLGTTAFTATAASSVFTINKTWISHSGNMQGGVVFNIYGDRTSGTVLTFQSRRTDDNSDSSTSSRAYIEIRVYN